MYNCTVPMTSCSTTLYSFWVSRHELGMSLYSNSLNIKIQDRSGWTKEQQVQRLQTRKRKERTRECQTGKTLRNLQSERYFSVKERLQRLIKGQICVRKQDWRCSVHSTERRQGFYTVGRKGSESTGSANGISQCHVCRSHCWSEQTTLV